MFSVTVLEHSDCYCRCYVISIMARQTLLLFCANLLFSWVVSWYLYIHGNAYSPKHMCYSDFRHLTLRTQRMRYYNYSVFYTGCSPAVIPKKLGLINVLRKQTTTSHRLITHWSQVLYLLSRGAGIFVCAIMYTIFLVKSPSACCRFWCILLLKTADTFHDFLM